MAAKIIDGKKVAERIWGDVGQQVADLAAQGQKLKLAAVMVGEASSLMVMSSAPVGAFSALNTWSSAEERPNGLKMAMSLSSREGNTFSRS